MSFSVPPRDRGRWPSLLGLALWVGLFLGSPGGGGIAGAAVLTLEDGATLTVEGLVIEAGTATFRVGTEPRALPLAAIRDVSFADAHGETDGGLRAGGAAPSDLVELLAKGKATHRRYPDATQVEVVDEGVSTWRADGTNSYRARSVVYIAKEEALSRASVSLGFERERERIKIHHARALDSKGRLHELDPDQVRVVKSSQGSEFFDNRMTMAFAVPGADVGGLIDICWEMEEFNPFDRKLWQTGFYFQGDDPVVESVFHVQMPTGQPFHYVALNLPGELASPTVTTGDGITTYTWRVVDSAPLITEPRMPPVRDVLPRVTGGLHRDFEYMFSVLRPMHEKRFQLTDAVKKKTDELVAGATTIEEKINRLYRFCQHEIRYISIKGNLASNQVGHPAEETLRNRYGDCTDKGMLLSTMLAHIGVKAWPVGVRTNDSGKALRELGIFDSNHCITEIELDGRRFFLDSTATDYRYPYFRSDDHDTLAVNVMTGEIKPVPLPPPASNAFLVRRTLEVEADGTTRVDYHAEMNGPTEASQRNHLRHQKPEEYLRQVRESVAGLAADYELTLATFSNPLDLTRPLTIDTRYLLRRYAPRSGRIMIFTIPFQGMRFPEVALEKRQFDIVYRTTSTNRHDITVLLPSRFRVKYLPPKLELETEYFRYLTDYQEQPPDATGRVSVRVVTEFTIKARTVPVAAYAEHQRALLQVARHGEERMFFEEITDENAAAAGAPPAANPVPTPPAPASAATTPVPEGQ